VSARYDVLIRNTTVVDGTGRPPFPGNVAVSGGRIAALGPVEGNAALEIDGTDRVTCPGFIDAHSHADLSILQFPGAENLIMQGITTFAGGNCGIALAPVKDRSYFDATAKAWNLDIKPSWASFGEFLRLVESAGIALNYVPLAGHNAIRGAVLGTTYQRPSRTNEVVAMRDLLAEALDSGCFGLSAGFDAATPGHHADRSEIIALVRLAGERNGLFAPHTRHHQNQWPADRAGQDAYGIYRGPKGEIITGRYHGLLEAVELSRLAGDVRLHLAHLTPAFLVPQPHPDYLDEALARATLESIIEEPASQGLEISFNVVCSPHSIGAELPILDSFYSGNAALPAWLRNMERETFIRKLRMRGFRDRLRRLADSGKMKFGMIHPITDPYWADSYVILSCANAEYAGKTLWELARRREPHHTAKAVYFDTMEVLCDILADDPAATWALARDKRECGTLQHFLRHPRGIPCTDVHALPAQPGSGRGIFNYGISPTAFGAFPYFLQAAVKQWRILSLEQAVRKITGFPAREVFGLADRGVLGPQAWADVVIMDFERLAAADDFRHPTKPPQGIEYVLVNGVLAYERGRFTGSRSGRLIRRR
jgi:N-acyl-D-amino-acid deacylase